jgi:hypothetical protein
LLETSLATVIIGVGVLAIVEAQQAFLRKNSWSSHTATAMFLANEIREMTRTLSRHDPFSGGLYWEDPDAHTGFRGWGPEAGEIGVDDFNDLDDYDGIAFGAAPAGDLPGVRTIQFEGPINSFGEVIPEMSWDGAVVVDVDGNPVPMRGWTQFIEVTKVESTDLTVGLADEFYEPAAGIDPEIEVGHYPVRVVVSVMYQGPFDTNASLVTQIEWVVPRF